MVSLFYFFAIRNYRVVENKTYTFSVTFPTAPKTTVTAKGDIVYEEVNRTGVSRLERYVAEMAAGSK